MRCLLLAFYLDPPSQSSQNQTQIQREMRLFEVGFRHCQQAEMLSREGLVPCIAEAEGGFEVSRSPIDSSRELSLVGGKVSLLVCSNAA